MCYASAFSHGCTHAWLLRLLLQNVLVFHKVNKLPHTYVLLKYTFSISYTNSLYLSPISHSGRRNILISGCHLLIFFIFVSLFNCNCYNLFICQIYVLDSRTARASPILEHVTTNKTKQGNSLAVIQILVEIGVGAFNYYLWNHS